MEKKHASSILNKISFTTINQKFQKIRKYAMSFVAISFAFAGYAIWSSYHEIAKAHELVYILKDGTAMQALASERASTLAVELRDHLKNFHRYFFDLDPDEKAIKASINLSFYLADGSAKKLYDDQVEHGFITGLVSGNVSQRVTLDSIALNTDTEPYSFRCMGTQTFTRESSVTTKNIITRGVIRNIDKSDNNPHGFLIERFEVEDNKLSKTINK